MPVTFGRYELGELLGRGGMGEVFRAYDTVRDRVVALKLLPQHLASDASFIARFRRESRLAAQLNEPHIIPIHDFGEIDGRLFIDMRLVEGQDLNAALTERRSLPPDVAVEVIAQLASALDAAHQRGLVHRDVKPSNVLLADLRADPDHVPFAYLVDFGIARTTGDRNTALTTTSSATVGTVAYMSPERISGEPGDGRADVYALACVLYETLTGAVPFGGEHFAMMYAHVNTPPPRAGDRVRGLPDELDAVIAKGLAKSPDARFATAGEFASAARAALRAHRRTDVIARAERKPSPFRREEDVPTRIVAPVTPLPAGTGPFVPPSGRPGHSRRRAGLLAAVAVVVLALAGVGVLLLTRNKDRTAHAATTTTASAPTGPLGSTARSAIRSGGTLTWAINDAVANFNPFEYPAGVANEPRLIADALLPAPFHFDAAGRPSVDGDFFASITPTSVSPLTVDYKINPRAKWSDGSAITYQDFVAQQHALSGAAGYAALIVPGYDQIASVTRGGDDRDVVVRFRTTFSDWQNLFAPLLPKTLTASSAAFNGSWAKAPAVTAGPFRWQGADATGSRYTLTRDPAWWGTEPAELDSITFAVTGDQSAVIAAARAHRVDFAVLSSPRAAHTLTGTGAIKGTSIRQTSLSPNFRALVVNTRRAPLDDVAVRRAIVLALDRKALATSSLGVKAEAQQNHFFTVGNPSYASTCGVYCTPDAAKAKQLLEGAGWRLVDTRYVKGSTPLALTITVPAGSNLQAEANVAQAALENIGFTVSVASDSAANFPDLVSKGQFQLAIYSLGAGRFPLSDLLGQYLRGNGGPTPFNPGAAGSAQIDALLVRAEQASTAAQRDAALNSASMAMWSDAAIVPLYPRIQPTLVTSTLVNLGAFGLADIRWTDIGYHR